MAPVTPLLEVRNLSVSYPNLRRKPILGPAPRVRILHGINFTAQKGEIIGIVGESGSGKSTLLKIAMGLLDVDSGTTSWGHETYPGYFAQDHRDQLDGVDATVESWLGDVCVGQGTGFVRGQLDEAQRLEAGDKPGL